MAQQNFKVSSTQDWIYPPYSYTGYGDNYVGSRPVTGYAWNKGHSVPARRGVRCYQGGDSYLDGDRNGNMMCFFFFRTIGSSVRLHDWIKSIGGASKITKITLWVYCNKAYSTEMRAQVFLSPFWNPEKSWNSGVSFDEAWRDSSAADAYGLQGCTSDSYSGTLSKHVVTQNIPKGQWSSINLTPYKYDVEKCQSMGLYVPGAYNRDRSAWGWVNGYYQEGTSTFDPKSPTLEIQYDDNSAPNPPTIRINSTLGTYGYSVPNLDITVVSNGDPDGNLHSSPYSYILYDENGSQIHNHDWTSDNRYTYDLSGYRGKTIKIKGQVRDTDGLIGESYMYVYINSQPYWEHTGMWFSSGVEQNIFQETITIRWNGAYDPQPEHNNNLRYRVYVQKETDNGIAGDVWDNAIADNLTDGSLTINAKSMTTLSGRKIYVNKGERIYFSVWAYDGLEWSSNRSVSPWIYREQPPSKPTNISPNGGHFENGVTVSWSPSSGVNGATIVKYVGYLCNKDYTPIRFYETTSTSFVCNDLTAIPRGERFFFRVVAIDNFNNESEPLESSWLTRNSYPSTPKDFRPVPNEYFFKDKIDLAWKKSIDPDNDEVKYDVFYNINGGSYKALALGISETSCRHNISNLPAGTKLNYYVEAFDTFGIRSWKAYIETEPTVNVPPQSQSILLPQNNRTIYCRTPRIVFRINPSTTGKRVKVIMRVNGREFDSESRPELFDKQWYSELEEGMFVVPEESQLNYSKTNTIEMKVFDGLDYSSSVYLNVPVEALTVEKIGEHEERFVKADELNKIRQMINKNRFAYDMPEARWIEGVEIGKIALFQHYYQAYEEIVGVVYRLNTKTTAQHLKRNFEIQGREVNKELFNKILDLISKS